MAHFLSKSDMKFLLSGGPKEISSRPMIRQQGNGNFTGIVLKTYEDGSKGEFQFIMNARTKDEVKAAYLTSGHAA